MDEIWCNCPPPKINGKYWMYFLGGARGQDTQMGVAYSEDLLHWTEALDHPVLSSRPGTFDSQVVEPGPPPVLTSEGIFLIYNGADDKFVYSTGWVLFDKTDPTKALARADHPIFWPQQEWEKWVRFRTSCLWKGSFGTGIIGSFTTEVPISILAWPPRR